MTTTLHGSLYSQIKADVFIGGSLEGVLTDARIYIPFWDDLSISPSVGIYTDGLSSDLFPRIGLTKTTINRNYNDNRITIGFQVSGIGSQIRLADRYNRNFLEFSPYIMIRKPLLRIPKPCYCGSQKGFLFELVTDLNLIYPSIGIGIRK